MKILLILSLSLLFLNTNAKSLINSDSVRVETRNGKKYIIHQVDPKETLFAISRRYNVSVEAITNENPGSLEGISIGQELTIPVVTSDISSDISSDQVSHFVDIGETLYSISKKYAVSVDDLKRWNNLTSNELNVGQQLNVQVSPIDDKTPLIVLKQSTTTTPVDVNSQYHIVEEQQTLFFISHEYGVTIEELQIWNQLDGTSISIGQRLIVGKDGQKPTETDVNEPLKEPKEEVDTVVNAVVAEIPEVIPLDADDVPEFNSRTVVEGDLEKIFEQGMARVIANSTSTKKYLALHRTADVGTVMKVKNMTNNLAIYVRVVGKLPDTGDNSKVLLKLSRTAYERLGAIDRQFPVEVSYIP